MKFMKLGSKPDLFKDEQSNARYVECELPPDLVVFVGETRFYLHKFPLLSKSQRLRRLLREGNGEDEPAGELRLHGVPGGPSAFEFCAKFCYGMTIIVNAVNVVAVRCAAEYLEMREESERGNLIHKIEVFLSSSVFQSWKDSIACLQSTKDFMPWAEELKIVGRCVDSVACKVSLDPRAVHFAYTYRRMADQGSRSNRVPVDWWVEDVAELDVDHFEMVLAKVNTPALIEGLKTYALRWLPTSAEELVSEEYVAWAESLVRRLLLLASRGCATCDFLLTLLKVVALTGEEHTKEELLTAVGSQLDKASVKDLLIPSRVPCVSAYDLDIVLELVSRFNGPPPLIVELVDGLLAEVATDSGLPLSAFLDFAVAVVGLKRASHDGLYYAVDIYLKGHPGLTKAEKKRLCGIIDVKKLSAGTRSQAVQNERMPLRMIVQVLFFEQVKAAAAVVSPAAAGETFLRAKSVSQAKFEEERGGTESGRERPTGKQLKGLLLAPNMDYSIATERTSQSSERSVDSLGPPSRSRRIFDRLWSWKTGKKSSEPCASPVNSIASVFPGRSRLSAAPHLKPGRHSIS